jgi:siroheme synthase-like protein
VPVDELLYPVNLAVTGRRCLVVGGGPVAARKVAGLLAAGAAVVVVSPEISAELDAVIAGQDVTVERRPYRGGDLEGVWLAIAATDDSGANQQVRVDADAARVWVNAADDPPACSFTLPAVVRQGPVMVTVSTSGYSPALATWLRGLVGEALGPEFATLAQLLSAARDELKAQGRSTEDVDWRSALDWDMLELIKAGDTAQARERLQACLSSSLD